MGNNVFLAGVLGLVVIIGPVVCHAEKWDKNSYKGNAIESGYYNADSIKLQGKAVNWTEKYILTKDGVKFITKQLSKYPVCKQNIVKKGDVIQYQLNYQIENGKFRGAAKRYYNKANELLCTDKDTANEFNTSWHTIQRGSSIQQAQYDLVTKYKVKFE